MKSHALEIIMQFTEKISLVVSLMLITLLRACNGQTKQHSMNQSQESEGIVPFDSVELEFRKIHETYRQDSMRMPPDSRKIFHNMERL